MNTYDFDETIFKGDCHRRFFGYCLLRLPYLILFLPFMLIFLLLRAVRLLNKNIYLYLMGAFVIFVPHKQKFVQKFWDKNFCRVKQWYINQKQPTDVIVSASPAFLVDEVCKRLGVQSIASNVDLNTYKLYGKHCHGKEKVVMFRKQFSQTPQAFYSDSYSDLPMMLYAKEGYLVKGDKIFLVCQNGKRLPTKKQLG